MPLWWLTTDQDRTCLALYERHYSCYEYKDGRQRFQFLGPGEKLVLRTRTGDACFAWRKFIDDCIDQRTGKPQEGVNCAFFRNEGETLSSELIREACRIADCEWPNLRRYTYVNSEKVRSSNPGFCFERAGWTKAGHTLGGLRVFELNLKGQNH